MPYIFIAIISDWVPTAYTGRLLQSVFSGGADRHKLITSFTQTNFITFTTSFKAKKRPQKLSLLVRLAFWAWIGIIVSPEFTVIRPDILSQNFLSSCIVFLSLMFFCLRLNSCQKVIKSALIVCLPKPHFRRRICCQTFGINELIMAEDKKLFHQMCNKRHCLHSVCFCKCLYVIRGFNIHLIKVNLLTYVFAEQAHTNLGAYILNK